MRLYKYLMKSAELYHSIFQDLTRAYNADEARSLARICIEDLLKRSFTHTMAGIAPDLGADECTLLSSAIERLLRHEPIQHIIGETIFCDIAFCVNKHVLIPRPETERIVSLAIELFENEENVSVMDLCTGSGCIAVSIKHKRPEWNVESCDISDEALSVARQNAERNNASIAFFKKDLLNDALSADAYDLIVSNPPYVMNKEKDSMKPNVLDYEPHLALFVDDDNPFVFYDAIATQGQTALHHDGWVIVEINSALGIETAELFESHGYKKIKIEKDCFGKDRFIVCQR